MEVKGGGVLSLYRHVGVAAGLGLGKMYRELLHLKYKVIVFPSENTKIQVNKDTVQNNISPVLFSSPLAWKLCHRISNNSRRETQKVE